MENPPSTAEPLPYSESSGSRQTFSVGIGWTQEHQRALDWGQPVSGTSPATSEFNNPYMGAHASWLGQWQGTHWGFTLNPVVQSFYPLTSNRISRNSLGLNALYLTFALDESHPSAEGHGLALGLLPVCEDRPKAIFGCYLEGSGAYSDGSLGAYSSVYAGQGTDPRSMIHDWTDSLSGPQFMHPMLRLRTGKPEGILKTEWALVLEDQGIDTRYNLSAWARIQAKVASGVTADVGLKAHHFRSQFSKTSSSSNLNSYRDTVYTTSQLDSLGFSLSSDRIYYRQKQTWIPTATLALSLDTLMKNHFGQANPWFSQTGFFMEAALLGIYDLPPYFNSAWQRTVLLFGADLPSRSWLQTFRSEIELHANREGLNLNGGNWRAGLLLAKNLGSGFSIRSRIQYWRYRRWSGFNSLAEIDDRTIPPMETRFRADLRLIWRMRL